LAKFMVADTMVRSASAEEDHSTGLGRQRPSRPSTFLHACQLSDEAFL
jgi:hypothetical protein